MTIILASKQKRKLQFNRNNDPLVLNAEWSWNRIQQLLDSKTILYSIRKTTVSKLDLAEELYGVLPEGKLELRQLREVAKNLHKQANRGTIQARQILHSYKKGIQAVIWACRMKLGAVLTAANPHQWGKRGYGLYLDIQKNLGRNNRVFFLTLTFSARQNFKAAREKLRGFTKNVLNRQGFWSLAVIAYHPSQDLNRVARLHAHLLVWPRDEGGAYHHTKALQKVEDAMKAGRYGIGLETMRLISGPEDFLKTSAYVAFNYDSTMRLDRNFSNPIPKGGRILSTPQEVSPGVKWERCKAFSFVTPASAAWRGAVTEYAKHNAHLLDDSLQWIWRRRRDIRKYLKPERWRVPSVTGLDGRNYRVVPFGGNCLEDEWFLMTNDERGSFIVDESCIERLGKLDGMAGALPVDDRKDPVSGQRVYVY